MAIDDNPFAAASEPLGGSADDLPGEGKEPVELEASAIGNRFAENLGQFGMVTAVTAGVLVALHFVMYVVNIALSVTMTMAVIALGLPEEAAQVAQLGGLLEGFLTSLLLLGAYRAYLTGVRGGEAEPRLLLSELRSVIPMFVASLMISLPLLLLLAPAVAVGVAAYYGEVAFEIAVGVGVGNFGLLMIVGLLVGTVFQFLGLIIVDQRVGPIEAIRESLRLTRGHLILLFVLVLLVGGASMFVSLFTCGFGAGVASALAAWIRVVVYRGLLAVNGRSPASSETAPV